MKQESDLLSIRQHLAILSQEVYIANSNNEQSINIHIENVLIPILNTIFDCKLNNANYYLSKNSVSIDLYDNSSRFAFQVTSTNSSEKIIKTLDKFKKTEDYKKYKRLVIVFIDNNKLNYNKTTKERIESLIGDNFIFDVKEDVIDFSDIYILLNKINNTSIISKVKSILEEQYSNIENINKYQERIQSFINEYKKAILSESFRRISFFGLATSRKPREIDLYSLFVEPKLGFYTSKNQSNIGKKFKVLTKNRGSSISYDLIEEDNKSFWQESFYQHTNHNHLQIKSNLSALVEAVAPSYLVKDEFDINYSLIYGNREPILYTDIINILDRSVILGKPGAGKSSLIKYTMCKILQGDKNVFSSDSAIDLIPFRVEIAEYQKNKKNNGDGFVKHILKLVKNTYHIDSLSENLLKYTLYNRKSIVFFDGLDEVFDLKDRIEIRSEIEFFASKYKNAKIIVTSRYESNEEIPFGSSFKAYEVMGFDDKQINEYVNKWYKIEESDPITREIELKSCKKELSKVADELKTNPLLLSLIVILYRNDLVLPTSKLEIYESCTNTLIQTRDAKEKKLDIIQKVNNIPATFSDLAYWQFIGIADKTIQNLSFDDILQHVKQYLLNKGECEDNTQALNVASHFLDFAKIRSIYFENSFTHKTFLEYFTSNYIFSNYYIKSSNKSIFYDILINNVGKASWAIVLELLLSKVDREQSDYEEMAIVLSKIQESSDIKTTIFVLQILKYLKNISPNSLRALFKIAIFFCLHNAHKSILNEERKLCFSSLMELIINPRFTTHLQISFKDINENIKNYDDMLIYNFFYLEHIYVTKRDLLYVYPIDKEIFKNDPYSFILITFKDFIDPRIFYNSLVKFVERFGVEALYVDYCTYFTENILAGESKFNWIIFSLFSKNTYKNFSRTLKVLKLLGANNENLIKAVKGSKIRFDNFIVDRKNIRSSIKLELIKAYYSSIPPKPI